MDWRYEEMFCFIYTFIIHGGLYTYDADKKSRKEELNINQWFTDKKGRQKTFFKACK